MEGIFTNLISNAIKYTLGGGKVTIRLDDHDGFVKVSVADTEIGIKSEDLPRIIDKFYRVKSTEALQIVGTGLGLFIVKSIVDARMGTISVESTEGKGTTFSPSFAESNDDGSVRERSVTPPFFPPLCNRPGFPCGHLFWKSAKNRFSCSKCRHAFEATCPQCRAVLMKRLHVPGRFHHRCPCP